MNNFNKCNSNLPLKMTNYVHIKINIMYDVYMKINVNYINIKRIKNITVFVTLNILYLITGSQFKLWTKVGQSSLNISPYRGQ